MLSDDLTRMGGDMPTDAMAWCTRGDMTTLHQQAVNSSKSPDVQPNAIRESDHDYARAPSTGS